MHHLGIPTTRAASVVVGSSCVERDMQYDGRPRMERCAVVARVAPTFLRFGSFEIFKVRSRLAQGADGRGAAAAAAAAARVATAAHRGAAEGDIDDAVQQGRGMRGAQRREKVDCGCRERSDLGPVRCAGPSLEPNDPEQPCNGR
eukprot:364904-Chlamydomonas_euryale.AAC.28